MQNSHRLHRSSLHVITDEIICPILTEWHICYTTYCCHTKVVKVSLPKLAGGVLKSTEEISRIHLENHTCAD